MRTRSIVSARLSPVKPGAITRDEERRREHAGQHEHRDDEREQRADGAGHAIGRAPLAAATRARRTPGMNDADSAPSPNRFWRKLGMRKAALNASAASERRPK